MEDNDEREIECVERQEISRKLQRITEKMDEQRREQEKGGGEKKWQHHKKWWKKKKHMSKRHTVELSGH